MLEKDSKATSTYVSDTSRLGTIEKWLKKWGLPLFPPTIASYKAIAATLKLGNYRSAHVYLQVYRVEAERAGYSTSLLQMRALKDAKKSCNRGLGAAARPRALPLEHLGKLPSDRQPWCIDGPVNPRAAIIMGSWWLCREIELSSSRVRLVELMVSDAGVPSVRWHLPASKNDTMAVGAGRTLCCCCDMVGRSGCPAHLSLGPLVVPP